MTDITNLTGLEKPLVKLIVTVGDGLGVAGNALFKFDEKKIRRTSKAEAEAEKYKIIKKAQGEAEALEILGRASQRFALEQFNKQINLENVVIKSQDLLSGKDVNNKPVDSDWTARFIGVAQDVSREDMQEVLARILAGEVQNPSTFSLRTLDVVKNLGQKDLEIFKRFSALSSTDVGVFIENPGSRENLQKYGLSFSEFIHLSDIGLFNPGSQLSLELNVSKGYQLEIDVARKVLMAVYDREVEAKVSFGVLKFTEAGRQLASIVTDESISENRDNFIKDFESLLKKKGFEVSE